MYFIDVWRWWGGDIELREGPKVTCYLLLVLCLKFLGVKVKGQLYDICARRPKGSFQGIFNVKIAVY